MLGVDDLRLGVLRTLRVLRALRAFRLVTKSASMQAMVKVRRGFSGGSRGRVRGGS